MKKTFTSMEYVLSLALAILCLPTATVVWGQAAEDGVGPVEKQMNAIERALNELQRLFATGATTTASKTTNSAWTTSVTLAEPSPDVQRTNDPIARIRDEGLNRSQVMQTLSYLTDVIGPRLTGSPNIKRANQWARDTMTAWGLTNGHQEAWGPFGRGWALKRFSAQVVEPQDIPLIAYPKAWSPGLRKPIVADVVYLDATSSAGLEEYKGKLKGAIVLVGPLREVKARYTPLATRLTETNLLALANAGPPSQRRAFLPTPPNAPAVAPRRPRNRPAPGGGAPTTNAAPSATNAPARGPARSPGRVPFTTQSLAFLAKEGAALIVSPSPMGDGGTYFVSAASVPPAESQGPDAPRRYVSAWATDAPPIPPQIAVATEDYNRLVRMIRQGEHLKMAVDLQVKFYNDDPMAYNTVAEIPGTDLKNEIVMLGGHIDSWHAGTGATDDGAGVAAAMEAVRIIQALKLQPRRTIRIGLWAGEEQGLLGSQAYVREHFGYYTNVAETTSRSPAPADGSPAARSASRSGSSRKLVRGREYERFSAYFNLDNGTGKIRGVYLQGNEAVRPLFRKWLEPFGDLGAETLTLSNTGGTDHLSFDAIGLPGFQFIQDPIDYSTRTHHSNADVFDRIQAEDVKQASVIMAAFIYHAAMMDEKVPRKPAE